MNAMIDTLRFAKRFEAAGFTPLQAETLTYAMAEAACVMRADAVTTTGLADASSRLNGGASRLGRSLLAVELDLDGAFADVRHAIRASAATMRNHVIMGIVVSQLALLIAILLLLPVH